MAFEKFGQKKQRQREREFYNKTKANANAQRRDTEKFSGKPMKTKPDPKWYYLAPTWAATVGGYILVVVLIQYLSMQLINLAPNEPDVGFFHNNGLFMWYFLLGLIGMPITFWYVRKKLYAIWFNNNVNLLDNDIEGYENDAYIRTIDHLTRELDIAPDVGLGFDGHVSTIMGHMMVSNKGIKKIDMPQYDPNVDGFVKRDENGNIVTKNVPMFNKDLGNMLYDMSGVNKQYRRWYDATDYEFNPKNRDGKRDGAYGRKEYEKLSDYINNEFYVLDTETERPAGVYFYDNRPVNTILIAITRGGKGCLPA